MHFSPSLPLMLAATLLASQDSIGTLLPARKQLAPVQRQEQQLTCNEQVLVTKILVLIPIYLNTYVAVNTSFEIYDDFTLSITNAPTTLDSVYTGTSTSFASWQNSSSNARSQLPTRIQYVESYSFVLKFITIAVQPNDQNIRKRQSSSGFVSGDGQTTNTCQGAVVYNLVNGQLFANTSTGATQFGTNPGVSYANFTPSANPGSITTIFSVDTKNNLLWGNTAFYNNAARFCVLSDGTIVAVFTDPALAPANCLFVVLNMNRVSSCAGAGAPGPSGPSGLQGVSGLVGATGISGAVGATGIPGQSGPSGPQGISGLIGATGLSGAVGASGVPGQSGPSGPPGISGLVGATGISGAVGATGISGAVGAQGLSGAVDKVRKEPLAWLDKQPTGLSGAPGPTGAIGIAFAYLGCWNQGCTASGCATVIGVAIPSYAFDNTTNFGGYAATFTGSASANIDNQCANLCITRYGANYFGTVNNGTTQGDCYCGNAITGTAATAGTLACQTCNGQVLGQCGLQVHLAVGSIAVYARAF